MLNEVFLHALFGDLREGEYIEIRVVEKDGRSQSHFLKSVDEVLEASTTITNQTHVYFGVAPRSRPTGDKNAVERVQALWADYDADKLDDDKEVARASVKLLLLPPSFVVDTGFGYHAYWLLSEDARPANAERVMRLIRDRTGGDNVWDASRVMRLPGSFNVKGDEPLECTIVEASPEARYSPADVEACTSLSDTIRIMVVSGQWEGDYKSRSERDFAVILALRRAGLSGDSIKAIFDYHPVGAKHVETGNARYLERTIKQVAARADSLNFMEENDCTAALGHRGWHRVATFTFDPVRLLEHEAGDVLVGTMRSRGFEWKDYQLPKSALSSVRALLRALPELTLMWEGSDRELRLFASYLMDKLMRAGFQKATGVQTIGRHADYWVTPTGTYNAEGLLEPDKAPVVYVPTERLVPRVNYTAGLELSDQAYRELLERMLQRLPIINTEGAIWPIIGWSFATPFKPLLENLSVRFPFLSLYGTRGSGKTATMQEAILPLLGYTEPRALDCATTQFVLLSWLSSTNAIPTALAEFRRSTLSPQEWGKLRRFLLASYDVGRDARGRADQTTQEYALTAPLSLDGEDKPLDPAIMERAIVVNLVPEDIREGTEHWTAFMELTALPLSSLAGRYILHTLGLRLKDVAARWAMATEAVRATFPQELPDRVRRNLGVCWFGVCAFKEFVTQQGVEFPDVTPVVLQQALDEVVSVSGRTFLYADDFVEDVVNAVSLHRASQFRWRYDPKTNLLWIHLAPALDWWYSERRRQGLDVLEPTAVKQQLKERDATKRPGRGQYMMGYKNLNIRGATVHMHAIDITAARAAGLDIPDSLEATLDVTIRLPKGGKAAT